MQSVKWKKVLLHFCFSHVFQKSKFDTKMLPGITLGILEAVGMEIWSSLIGATSGTTLRQKFTWKRFNSKEEAILVFVYIFLDGCVFFSICMSIIEVSVCLSSWSLSLSRLVFVSVSLGVRLGVSYSRVMSLSVCVISLSVCVISLIFCVFTLCVCVFLSLCLCLYFLTLFLSLSWCWCLSLDVGFSPLDCVVSLWYWNFLKRASFLWITPHSYCAS